MGPAPCSTCKNKKLEKDNIRMRGNIILYRQPQQTYEELQPPEFVRQVPPRRLQMMTEIDHASSVRLDLERNLAYVMESNASEKSSEHTASGIMI